ncbi:MAG: PilZ domain-containing protein, partial [Proteobacteria bacterium]|nr:PilZ domain-containing protein [Pseudomonadota bacterium]
MLFVEYEGADDLIGYFTENLSTGGTFVATSRELPIGTRVQLGLSFPGLLEPISIVGVVRWHRTEGDEEGGAGAGIQFEAGPGRDQLATIVERIRTHDPRTVSRLFRMLVVEDNRHVAALIKDGLRGSSRRDFNDNVSFVFTSAEDGRAAIELLK